ncbi:MAG: MarR family transcriptional regulator [Calditrichia bacterium]
MELEKEIKQAYFKSEHHKLAVNILYTAGWLTYNDSRLCRDFGLTIQQYNMLKILKTQHPVPATVNSLTEQMPDKTSNASRIVERLYAKELVSRSVSERDRRSVDVAITGKGLGILEQLEPVIDRSREELHTLSSQEARENLLGQR